MGNDVITLIIDAKNLASAQLKGLQKDLGNTKSQVSATDAAMNRAGLVAKGTLALGFAAAAYEAGRFVGGSLDAFRQEEVGISRLSAALKANVEGWNGNTDAIEANIKARMNASGFDDGALRDSLGTLVAATHSVSKAFDVQSVAMDLARFRGISLAEASDALVKVEAGQYRALKSLGIVLKEGATQTDALAAVQKVAGGQMAAYMQDGAGKSELLDAKLGNLQETLGEKLTPALISATEAATGLVDVLSGDAAPVTERFIADAYKAKDPIQGIGDAIHDTIEFLTAWDEQTMAAAERQQAAWDKTIAAAAEGAESWDRYSERASGPIRATTAAIEQQGPKWYTATLANMGQVQKAIHDGAAKVAQAWRDAMSQRNQAANAADQIIVNNAEIAAQKKILADKKATAAEKAEARIRLRNLRADNQALQKEMELLVNKGYVYGRGFTLGFVRGLVADTDRVGDSARALSRVVKKYLQVHSPSELGPFSEMGGPDGWGRRFGELWAGGLAATAGAAAGASSGYAGAVAMPSGIRGGGGGGFGAGGAAGVTVNLTFSSALPPGQAQIREAVDLIDAELRQRFAGFSPAAGR